MTDKIEPLPDDAGISPLTPGAMSPLLHLAIEKGVSVETLEKLVTLHERVADRMAAQEFAGAMAAFQEECPPIRKTSTARVTTSSGGQYTYQYAELDEIARTVRPLLHKRGLSYSWDSESTDATIRVTCTISHVNGHKVTARFEAPTAALTKAMSEQQKVAAALTYGKRQSLIQALGLTTCDPDDDGGTASTETVSPAQVELLEALLDKRPPGARKLLLDYLGVESMEAIPASRFEYVKSTLEAKIKAGK